MDVRSDQIYRNIEQMTDQKNRDKGDQAPRKRTQRVDYSGNNYNLYIVAISLGVGLTPTLSGNFFAKLPMFLQPLLHSGILLATVSAVILNLFFNGYHPKKESPAT